MPVLATSDVLIRVKQEQFNREIDKSEKKFKQFGRNIDETSKTIARNIFGLTIAASAVSGAIIKIGVDFEKEMATVGAVSRASAEEFEDLTNIAREMGAVTEWSATQSASALKFMAMAGFSAKEQIAALPNILDLATAGQLDLARASDIATDTLTAMGLEVEDLSRLNDVLIGTITRTNTDINMLGESFKYVAPIAGQLNYSLEQTSAMLGILANSGIKASDAGTDLRQALLRTAKAVKTLGMEEGSTLIDVLKEMEKRQTSVNDTQEMFGMIALKSVLVLRKNIAAYEDLHGTLKDVKGEAKTVAGLMRDTLGGAFKELGSSMQENALRLFDIMKDDLRDLVARALEVSKAIGEWIKANRNLINSDILKYIKEVKDEIKGLWDFFQSHPDLIKYGMIGMLMGRKQALLLGSMAHMVKVIGNMAKAIDAVDKGSLRMSDFAKSNFEELDNLLSGIKVTTGIDADIEKTQKIIVDLEKDIKRLKRASSGSFFGTSSGEVRHIQDQMVALGKYQGQLISLQKFKELELKPILEEKEIQAMWAEMQKYWDEHQLKIETTTKNEKALKTFNDQLDKLFYNYQAEINIEIENQEELEDLFEEMGTYVFKDIEKPEASFGGSVDSFGSLVGENISWSGIILGILDLVEGIVNIPQAIADAVISLGETFADWADNAFEKNEILADTIVEAFAGIEKFWEELMPEIWNMITEGQNKLWDGFANASQAMIGSIGDIIKGFIKDIPNLVKAVISASVIFNTSGMVGGGNVDNSELIAALESAAISAENIVADIKTWNRDVAFAKAEDPVQFLKDELSVLAADIAQETDSQKQIEIMEKQWEITKELYEVSKQQLDNLKESSKSIQNALDTLTFSGSTTSLNSAMGRYQELFEVAQSGESEDVSAFIGFQEQYMSFLEAAGVDFELMRKRSISDLESLQIIVEDKQSEYEDLQQSIENNTFENAVGLDSVVSALAEINTTIGELELENTNAFDAIWGKLRKELHRLFEDWAAPAWEFFNEFPRIMWEFRDTLKDWQDEMWGKFKENWGEQWHDLDDFFNGLWDGLRNFIDDLGHFFDNLWDDIWDGIKGLFDGIIDEIKDVFGDLGLGGSGGDSGIGGVIFDVGHFLGFADGGRSDTTAIFAEDGPEWAVPAANNNKNSDFLQSVGIDKVLQTVEKNMGRYNSGGGSQTIVVQLSNGIEIARQVVKTAQRDPETQQGLKRAVA